MPAMAFSDFDLRTVLERVGLMEVRDVDLFAGVAPLEPTRFMRRLAGRVPGGVGVNTEKAQRIRHRAAPGRSASAGRGEANVLPGVMLDVDRERGLCGFCDFLISGSAEYYYLRGPLAVVVEARAGGPDRGPGPVRGVDGRRALFNDRDGTPIPAVYGCVTSGSIWRFLKLAGDQLSIDRQEYYLRDANKIVGILVHIMAQGRRA